MNRSEPPVTGHEPALRDQRFDTSESEHCWAAVLAAIDETEIFETTPTAILCPGCGDTVTTFETGMPYIVPQFATRCSTCEVALRRWCVVAVDVAYTDLAEPARLTAMTQAYWDQWLWPGITNHKDEPRQDEYTERLRDKAQEFDWDWEVRCPLCRRNKIELERELPRFDGLDYHHWSDNPDRGIHLCRDCHNIIGFHAYDQEVEAKAHKWGFRSRNDLQVIRLALRDAIVREHPLRPARAADLVERYNLIQSATAVKLLIDAVRDNPDLADRVVDETLWDGLPDESETADRLSRSQLLP